MRERHPVQQSRHPASDRPPPIGSGRVMATGRLGGQREGPKARSDGAAGLPRSLRRPRTPPSSGRPRRRAALRNRWPAGGDRVSRDGTGRGSGPDDADDREEGGPCSETGGGAASAAYFSGASRRAACSRGAKALTLPATQPSPPGTGTRERVEPTALRAVGAQAGLAVRRPYPADPAWLGRSSSNAVGRRTSQAYWHRADIGCMLCRATRALHVSSASELGAWQGRRWLLSRVPVRVTRRIGLAAEFKVRQPIRRLRRARQMS